MLFHIHVLKKVLPHATYNQFCSVTAYSRDPPIIMKLFRKILIFWIYIVSGGFSSYSSSSKWNEFIISNFYVFYVFCFSFHHIFFQIGCNNNKNFDYKIDGAPYCQNSNTIGKTFSDKNWDVQLHTRMKMTILRKNIKERISPLNMRPRNLIIMLLVCIIFVLHIYSYPSN